jgi:IS5 family transposase
VRSTQRPWAYTVLAAPVTFQKTTCPGPLWVIATSLGFVPCIAKGRPVCLLISPGEIHDVSCAEALLDGLEKGAVVIADKGYDADRVRARIRAQDAIPNIPNRSHRKKKFR